MTPPEEAGANDEEPTQTKSPESRASEEIQRFRDAIDKLRSRADLSAKAFGGLGITALGGIGIAKISDVFPFPDVSFLTGAVITTGLVGGFVGMACVVSYITRRLWHVNDPILMISDTEGMREHLSPEEQQLVCEIYADVAALHGVPSLRAYEARSRRLERIADRREQSEPPASGTEQIGATPERLREQAGQIGDEIRKTFARAAHSVVRRRAMDAVIGEGPRMAYALFLLCFFAFVFSADYFEGERSDRIAIAKSCAEAAEAGAAAEDLPKICSARKSSDEVGAKVPKADVADGIAKLATSLKGCYAAVASTKEDDSATCAPLERAIRTSLRP